MPSVDALRPAPPTVIGPTTQKATRPSHPLPQWLIDGARVDKQEVFDARRDLNFQPPSGITTMREIGLEGHGISPVAASEPFPLFTPAAIKQMRAEIFSEPVLKDCQYSSSFAKNMIRGMGRERAPFTCDAWSSPELQRIVSRIAGVDLVVAFDYEIANINISVSDASAVAMVQEKPDTSAFAWHYDSFPFVCVTMLSDCSDMIGGETAIRTPAGEIKKIRGPAMALKALGGRERISMVTPFRPRDPSVRDELVLTGSRAISNWSELYHGFTEYRLELLEERIRLKLKEERKRVDTKRPFNIAGMTEFLAEQKDFLEATIAELTVVEEMDSCRG
ncbi:hypothetical protein ASPACDRAFT_1889651 [Aspergillus aculeatus ATCC 16872]|uniref:Fe2OG dioxygenase domain-containing protein n=1 Tax=Aspergillus aculeatus (strain ATCC 16872 / CBS 172.66 / WB 5094) TaxID=690307 RepID=A0A1L9WR10_ASPA1|nr:uncharacterized protein ASPACDRAFT_1889651 [Aspergillus aculeatus ATCC 16872]OJJ98477.1 hypothetical protein ASPACDRAFT_1889651 [Aspergillus aculeatus ATCC 16872]